MAFKTFQKFGLTRSYLWDTFDNHQSLNNGLPLPLMKISRFSLKNKNQKLNPKFGGLIESKKRLKLSINALYQYSISTPSIISLFKLRITLASSLTWMLLNKIKSLNLICAPITFTNQSCSSQDTHNIWVTKYSTTLTLIKLISSMTH